MSYLRIEFNSKKNYGNGWKLIGGSDDIDTEKTFIDNSMIYTKDSDYPEGLKGWFYVQPVNYGKTCIENIKEVRMYQTVPEEERWTKTTFTNGGGIFGTYDIPVGSVSGRLTLDIYNELPKDDFTSNATFINQKGLKGGYSDYQHDKIELDEITINLYALPGLKWDTLKCENNYKTVPVPLNDDETVGTMTLIPERNVFFRGTTIGNVEPEEPEEVLLPITYELTNCSCDENPINVIEGVETTLNFTPNQDYEFSSTGYVKTYRNVEGGVLPTTFTIEPSEDKKTASVTFIAYDKITINLGASVEEQPIKIEWSLTNCTCDFTDDETPNNVDVNLTFIANEGYVFNEEGVINTQLVNHYINDFNDDKTQAYWSGKFYSKPDRPITIKLKASEKKAPEELGNNFTNIHVINEELLNQLAKVRFVKGVDTQVFDYGQFINELYTLPFKINDDDLSKDTKSIMFGEYNTKVSSKYLLKNVLTFNVGEITVKEKYKNVYDYINTDVILYLPYCNAIPIDINYIMNNTIIINYVVDLYTSDTTVNIISKQTGKVFYTTTLTIGYKIPFIQKQTSNKVGTIGTQLFNGVTTPYLEITRNKPYNINTIFGKPTIDYGVLGSYSGYVEVKDIMLNVKSTNDEKDEIYNLLKNGVYINSGV